MTCIFRYLSIFRTLSLCVAAVLAASAAYADPVKLKLAMFSADTEMTWVAVIKPWADAVNAAGKGIIEIDGYTNGALGKALPEQPQIVLDGVADIAFVIPGVSPGRFPDNEVMDLPGFFTSMDEATKVYSRLMAKGVLKSFEKYHVIGAMGTPPFWIHARSKITSLADLKGKKLRGTNPSQSATLKGLGAVPVLMPVNEVPEAIGRGTIDGAVTFPGPLIDFGIDRVTKYDYALPIGISSLTLLMNKEKYASLTPEAKAVIDKFGLDWIAERFTGGYGAYVAGLYEKLKAESGRVSTQPAREDLDKANAVYDKVIEEWAKKKPGNEDLVKALRTELAVLRGH